MKQFWKKKFRFDYHNYIRNKYFKPVLYVMDNMYDSYIYTANKVPPCLQAEEYFIINTLNRILKPEGKLVALFFPLDKELNDDGPPFGIDLKSTLSLFSKHFTVDKKEIPNLSIERRIGREMFLILNKNGKRGIFSIKRQTRVIFT